MPKVTRINAGRRSSLVPRRSLLSPREGPQQLQEGGALVGIQAARGRVIGQQALVKSLALGKLAEPGFQSAYGVVKNAHTLRPLEIMAERVIPAAAGF